MKSKEVELENKKVFITKDLLQKTFGIILVFFSIALGVLAQLGSTGWDLTSVRTIAFWMGLFSKLACAYLAYAGVYIVRRTRNLQTQKVLSQRAKIKDLKKEIVDNDKIESCEYWLKNIHNYGNKIELYQKMVTKNLTKYNIEEPVKPNFDDPKKSNYTYVDKNKDLRKIKKINKKYEKDYQNYLISIEKRKYYEEQRDVCKIHTQILEAYLKKDFKTVESLKNQIELNDDLKRYDLNYEDIYYDELFNIEIESEAGAESIRYNEHLKHSKQLISSLVLSFAVAFVLNSIFFTQYAMTFELILNIVITLCYIVTHIFTAILRADYNVFKVIYTKDSRRVDICNKFKECDKKYGVWKDMKKETKNDEKTIGD